eukprot:Selendium_serpulae@DN6081_c0_g1_i3.p1
MQKMEKCSIAIIVATLLVYHTALVSGGPAQRHGAASLSGRVERTAGGGSGADVRYIDLMTAAEYAASRPELSKLSTLYHDTEMRFKLEQSRHITVLMPTNKALDRAARDGIDLEHAPYDVVLPIMQTLVIPEVVKLQELDAGTHEFKAMDGTTLRFVKPENANKPGTVNGATLGHEIDNANGVAYALSTLIYPETMDVDAVRAGKGSSPHEDFDVPDHVEMTNEMHSRYDQQPSGERMEPDEVEDTVEQAGVIGEITQDDTGSSESSPTGSLGVIPGAGLLPPENSNTRGSTRKSHVVSSGRTTVRRRNRNDN